MSKNLVIVESPAKARTIKQYLGPSYEVTASYGHIRDLPESAAEIPADVKGKPWANLGVNTEANFEPIYVVSRDKKRHVDALKDAAKTAERILLATDEDREGESISWHVLQVLKPKKTTKVERIVFHEITPEAIQHAISNPRALDEALVRAQETRRILDRLFGYTLSPLLWKKVRRGLSAGRVQSVAVRLTVLRERERRDFRTVAYSGLEAEVVAQSGSFVVKLAKIRENDTILDEAWRNVADGQSFDSLGNLEKAADFHLRTEDDPGLAGRLLKANPWEVTSVENKPGVENPPPPFMTSTLQQEANRKLGYPARRTMQIAQNLYEGVAIGGQLTGLITYMRTDSLTLAERALTEARDAIRERFGAEYLPKEPKRWASKAKNAQEAHEAIRPTDLRRDPQSIQGSLSPEQFKLYDLIWKRTLACQMNQARVERTRVEVEVTEGQRSYGFSASGKRILFPGFLRVYVEGADDPEAELGDKERILPAVKEGEQVEPKSVEATEHETRPPARYTEASLVKRLEEEGIGRPSTYASIIGTIQDRDYVNLKGKELIPTFTAFAVTELLEANFEEYVDLGFTARMEEELDQIAEGERDAVAHLRTFYQGTEGKPGLDTEVKQRGPEIAFPVIPLGPDVVVRIGRNGPFIQRGEGGPGNTASVPEDMAPADLTLEAALALLETRSSGPASLGTDAATGQEIFLKSGRFGPYLESGEKRVSLPPGVSAENVDDQMIQQLFSFPRALGSDANGDAVEVLIGKFGAYVKCGGKSANVGDWKAGVELTLEQALEALASKSFGAGSRQSPAALKEFGAIAGLAGPVKLMSGRYGPYVTDGKTNATLPKGLDPESLTAEAAAELIKAKAAAGPSKRPFRRSKRKG